MERDRGPRGLAAVDLGFGALSTAQLRALMRDETWLERIVKLSRKDQMAQLLCWDLPVETFVDSFQHSRELSHLRRTQLEKLQEILKLEKEKAPEKPGPGSEEQPATSLGPSPAPPAPAPAAPVQNGPPAPKVFQLRLAPAFLIPSEAVLPIPVAAAPQKCRLPAMAPPHPTAPFVSKPLSLIGHFHLPQAHLPHQHKKKEPPHR
uniref:VPS37D subunit of ESCRT-I n=1 Tax=Varanus komodoensis TaxID=61221 RepID=A0A8D2J6B6_VARKO